jgi:hypothetical protein
MAREIVAHHRVAPLGQPVDLVEAPERAVAETEEPDAKARAISPTSRTCAASASRQAAAVSEAPRQLELPAGLERDAIVPARERDELAVLFGRGEPTGARRCNTSAMPPGLRYWTGSPPAARRSSPAPRRSGTRRPLCPARK